MRKKELSKLLVAVVATSSITNASSISTFAVDTKEANNTYINQNSMEEKTQEEKTNETVFLSNISYDTKMSATDYKHITKDTNTDGKKIKLLVDGEVVEFEKGMGAHATSTLVYDLSNYSTEYTRFVSYVGVDYAQAGRGNGVKFTISTSQDGINWTPVKELGVLTSNKDSAYVDINIKGVKYLKLYANDNGKNGNDHAVYGDAKLVKDDYTISATPISGLKPIEEYDKILNANSIEDNLANNEMTILRRAFVERIGYESIQRIASKSESYGEAINYLMTNEDALRYFIAGGPVTLEGSYTSSLKYFCDIYSKYAVEIKSGREDNFDLRLAISISLSYSKIELVRFWIISEKPLDAVRRYELYKELIDSGRMDKGGNTPNHGKWSSAQFKALPIPLMRGLWITELMMMKSCG